MKDKVVDMTHETFMVKKVEEMALRELNNLGNCISSIFTTDCKCLSSMRPIVGSI